MSKIFSRDDFDRILSTGVQTEREDDDDEIDQGSFNREKFDQILNGTFDNTQPDVEPTRWEPPKSTKDSTSESNEPEGNIFSKIKNVFKSAKKKYEDVKEVETNYTEEDYQIYSPLALERLNALNQELSIYEDKYNEDNSNIGKKVINLVKGEAGILGTIGKDKGNKGGIEAIKDAKNRTWEENERMNKENEDEKMTVAAKMEERAMISAFLDRKDVKSGFFDGLKVAVKEGRFVPFLYNQDQAKRKELTLEALQKFQDTDQKELMNVSETIKKFQGDEELSELDKALVQRMQAEALASRIDKGLPYGLGESLVDMARYGFEFAALGGLAEGVVGGATKVLPKAAKILPKRLAGSFMQKLTTEMAEALVQTGMNAPMLSEKTAEYALPEYEIMTSEDGEMLLKEASQGDDPTTAFKKAFLSSYAEHFSERAGGLIKSGGSSVYKKIVERMGLITENPENFIQKALIGKLISKSSNKSTTVFARYLRATKFDGILEEVMEEELNEPVQAMIEDRDYSAPIITEEGNARLVMEILGIGMYGGLLKIPDKTVSTINKWRERRSDFKTVEIPVDEEENISFDNLPSVVREEMEAIQNDNQAVVAGEEGIELVEDVNTQGDTIEEGVEDMPDDVNTLLNEEAPTSLLGEEGVKVEGNMKTNNKKNQSVEEQAEQVAVNLIKGYVERGDSIGDLNSLGSVTDEGWAEVKRNKIIVTKIGGNEVNISLPLEKIYNKIKNDLRLVEEDKELPQVLRGTKGMTADDIMQTYPNIQLKKDVPAKDIYGKKVEIPEGEKLTPYELKGNKILLQDGETYILTKNQFQNIRGNSVVAEGKPFAPELEGLEEVIKGAKNYAELSKKDWEALPDKVKKILEESGDNVNSDAVGQIKKEGYVADVDMDGSLVSLSRITEGEPTKFNQYTLPGGEDYKEILIKAPAAPMSETVKEYIGEMKEKYNAKSRAEYYPKMTQLERDTLSDLLQSDYSDNPAFVSSHWDDPNVLAHLRVNNREFEGGKVLFMEELQSDWARKGRDIGFDNWVKPKRLEDLLPEGWSISSNGDTFKVVDITGNVVPNKLGEGEADGGSTSVAVGKAVGEKRLLGDYKPGVPYNSLLKNWQVLTIKRALLEAVNNKAEYFAWISGEQTSARYDLATQVESVKWGKSDVGDDFKSVTIDPKNSSNKIALNFNNDTGIINFARSEWQGKKLDEVLGKGLADQIMGKENGELSGEGLKFGGEWAENLYDKQVKAIVEDITGGEVTTIDLGLPVSSIETYDVVDMSQVPTRTKLTPNNVKVGADLYDSKQVAHVVTDIISEGKIKIIRKSNLSPNEAQGLFDRTLTEEQLRLYDELKIEVDLSPETVKQQAIKLTPEIVAKIKGETPVIETSGKQFEEPKLSLRERAKALDIDLPSKFTSKQQRLSLIQLVDNSDKLIDTYIKTFTKEGGLIPVNGDNAKTLFDDYNKTDDVNFDIAGGNLAKLVYRRALELKKDDPLPVLFSSGGTGSGKSTITDVIENDYSIFFDSNLGNLDRGLQRINEALAYGKQIDIVHISRDATESFTDGVLQRFREGDERTVPVTTHVNQHIAAIDVMKQLIDRFNTSADITLRVYNNNLGYNKAEEVEISFIEGIRYNKEELINHLQNHVRQQYKEGQLTEEQAIALIGGKGSLDNTSAERRDGEEQIERKTNSTKGLTPTQEDIPSNTDIKLSIIDQLSNELSVVLDVDLGVERWGTDEEGYKWVGVHAKYPSWLPEYLHKKDAIGKALEKLGSPKTISLRKGSNAEEVYKEIRKEAVNRYREEVRKYGEEADTYSGSGEASVGMFATEEELLKKISNDVPPAIQMPEMVSIYRQLTDGNIVEVRHRMGNKLGFHQAGRIAIKGDLFIDEEQATKTLAHELGHLVDFLPDNTMKRGNLLGRIASLNSFLKGKLVSKEVADKVDVLVKEREGYQKERKKIKEMRVEMGTGANAYKNEDRYFYKKIREVNKKIDELQKDAIANKAITSELRALTMLWKPFDPSMNETFTNYRYSGKELYADAISVLFVRPDLLKTKAPKFWTAFWQYLNNKPDVMQAVLETYDILYKGKDAIGSERNKKLMDMFNKGEEVATAKIAEIQDSKVGYLFLTKYLFLDKNAAVIDKINELKKRGTNLSPQENPIYALEGNNYLDSKIKAYLEKFITPVDKRLEKAKLTWNDLGELLFLERVRDERGGVVDLVDMIEEQLPEVSQNIIETLSDVLGKPVYEQYTILQDTLPVETWNQIKEILPAGIANPQGYTTTTARDQINYLKSNYEPARWEQLTKAKEEFRASVKEVNRRAREAGYYTEDIQNLIESNESYATFQVLDYLELYISPQVYGQKGTFKDVANPAVSTIIKNMSVLSAIERNETKKKLVGMLLREFPDEVTLAQVKQNGKRQQIIDTRSPGLGTIKLIVNGKLQGYYVDKYIANTVNVMRNDVLTAFSSILSMPNKIYRPLFTSLNLGFQSFNFVRDFTRYWKNMPDASIGEALTSLPRAFYRYAQAVPHAWGRASNKPDKLIREMDELGILGTTYNDIFNNPDKADQQIDRILIKADLKSLSPKQKQKIFIVPFAKALNVVEIFGNFIETLPKVAGYKELKGKMPDEQLVSFLRTRVGSPDFRRGGAATPITNNIFLFSNAIKEGWRADLASLKDPTTRSGLVWKTMLITIFPKLLMFLVTKGLLGDELEKMMRDASEYDKSNYIMIPLGRTEEGKTQFLRVPQDETGRFIGGLFWKTLTTISSEELELNDIFQLLDYGAGQFPSVSPIYTGAGAVISYLSGRNPYDAFRGRYVIPDDEFEAGAKYSFPIFMDWLIKNQGAGIVLPNFSAYKNDAMSGLEKVLNAPMLANTLGRWIRVTDQGTREEAYEPVLEERQQKAVEKLEREESMENYIKLYLKSDKSESNKNYYINQFLEEQLGAPPYKGTVKAQATNYRKSFMKELFARSGKNELASLKSLGSNAEKKAYINSVKNNMSKEEFEIFLEEALENKFISEPLREEF